MRFYNNDCLEILQGDEITSVDYSFTSPPYNRKRNDKYENYDDTVKDWFEWNRQIISHLLRVTNEYVFYNIQPNYYNKSEFYKLVGEFSQNIVEVIVWEKTNPMPASGGSITNSVEYFLVLGNKSLKSKSTYTKNHITSSVNSKMPKHHKAVMKQEICDWFFEKFMHENKTVLDCFMGLGTTGISAKKYGLDFIGIEKDKQYFDEAVLNIEQAKPEEKELKKSLSKILGI